MKTKREGVPKAFDPYTRGEIELVLSLVPTRANVANLAQSLGRTEDAIWTLYELAYSGRWLKKQLARFGPHQDNVTTKIGQAKKKLGIGIGHIPK
ncbi:MAG: hypothetical protein WEE64_07740 [Dehalococcoidia bacterium]